MLQSLFRSRLVLLGIAIGVSSISIIFLSLSFEGQNTMLSKLVSSSDFVQSKIRVLTLV